MAEFQTTASSFLKSIGTVIAPISGLQFAAFFGDGTVNPRDNTNLVPGGSTFANIGSGPDLSPTFGDFTNVTKCLDTGMADAYPNPTTIIVAAAKPAVGPPAGATLAQFSTNVAAGTCLFVASHVSTIVGNIVSSGDVLTVSSAPPAFPTFGLYAWVITPGAVSMLYDLTRAGTATGTVTNTMVGPHSGTWQIGSYVSALGGSSTPVQIAFALGAATGLNLTQLNAFAAALRFPLAARGIIV